MIESEYYSMTCEYTPRNDSFFSTKYPTISSQHTPTTKLLNFEFERTTTWQDPQVHKPLNLDIYNIKPSPDVNKDFVILAKQVHPVRLPYTKLTSSCMNKTYTDDAKPTNSNRGVKKSVSETNRRFYVRRCLRQLQSVPFLAFISNAPAIRHHSDANEPFRVPRTNNSCNQIANGPVNIYTKYV